MTCSERMRWLLRSRWQSWRPYRPISFSASKEETPNDIDGCGQRVGRKLRELGMEYFGLEQASCFNACSRNAFLRALDTAPADAMTRGLDAMAILLQWRRASERAAVAKICDLMQRSLAGT